MTLHRCGRAPGWPILAAAFTAVAFTVAAAFAPTYADPPAKDTLPPYLADQPAFNPTILSTLPGDVDMTLKKNLENAGKFSDVQREFDLNAWQMFLAVNWPVEADGKPKKALTDPGELLWSRWTPSYLVYQSDGKKPAACAAGVRAEASLTAPDNANLSVSRGLPPLSKLKAKTKTKTKTTTTAMTAAATSGAPRRMLGTISSVGELNVAKLSEINQAFSGPLIDQNGQLVFYDIVMDPHEVKYLCDNQLYTINGQVAFSKAGKTVVMPSGTSATDGSGSFELKLAWKILQGSDVVDRFYHVPATVADIDGNGNIIARDVTVGLVGMHIAHKSESSPQWIWATFEQIDNIDVDQVANPGVNPSFMNPGCPSCAVNLPTRTTGTGALDRTPTQVWRAIPIPGDKVALNLEARAALKSLGSVWQYYQLVDTQWPTEPTAPPTPSSAGAPSAVNNKSGGNPTPVFLTNATMETFFQHGNQRACEQVEGGCAPGSSATTDPTPKQVFATESCIGCHSSAGIFTSYDAAKGSGNTSGQLTADFSWLPSQKACWAGGPPGTGQNCTAP